LKVITNFISFFIKLFSWMRHVVSAYVSNSRCGSTTEAYLGAIGTVIIAVNHCLLEASERLGAVVTVLRT
jgi:hypothetical protein